jgi:hypothetical protein
MNNRDQQTQLMIKAIDYSATDKPKISFEIQVAAV